jgi:hypothetical protein
VEVQWKGPRASVLGSLRRDHDRDDALEGAAFQPWELAFCVFSACVWGLAAASSRARHHRRLSGPLAVQRAGLRRVRRGGEEAGVQDLAVRQEKQLRSLAQSSMAK